jgi:hypothetical protein
VRHHPVMSEPPQHDDPIHREIEHLTEVVKEGDSAETPLILGLSVWLVVTAVVAVVLGVVLLAYYLA